MSKKVKFELDGKNYTLEFTRKTIQEMESEGFRIDELSDRPMTLLPQLFIGAFKCHHPYMNRREVMKIFDQIADRRSLLETLNEMYQEPIQAILDASNGDQGKNIKWTATEN